MAGDVHLSGNGLHNSAKTGTSGLLASFFGISFVPAMVAIGLGMTAQDLDLGLELGMRFNTPPCFGGTSSFWNQAFCFLIDIVEPLK